MFDCIYKTLTKLLFLTGLLFLFTNSMSQVEEIGLPNVVNFSPREYRQESQNYSITQDERGYMYFGNLNGIMMFDNSEWRFVKYKGRPILVHGNNNIIYVGGYNRISKLILENGILKLEDFKIPSNIVPNQINKVVVRENDVLFVADNYILKLQDNKVKLLYFNERKLNAFYLKDEVYITINELGLYTLNNDDINSVNYNHYFVGKNIIDVFSDHNQNIVIKTENEAGFYKQKDGQINYFNSQIDYFISANGYSKSLALKNGNIIIGTVFGGLVCIDSIGNYMFSLNKRNLLLDNHITDIFLDNNSKIWLTTYNGISQIDVKSPYSFIDDNLGLYGVISSIIRYKNKLFFGTSQGVYYSSNDLNYDYDINGFSDDKKYVKLYQSIGEAQHLRLINNELYVAATSGIFKILDGQNANLIIQGYFRQLHQSEFNDSIVYATGRNGLLVLKNENNILKQIGYINGLDYDVRTIVHEAANIIWLGSNNDGFFRLEFNNDDILNPEIVQYNSGFGLPEEYEWADVYKTSFGILFSTGKGIYSFNNEEFKFDTRFSEDVLHPNSYYPLVEDKNKRLWFCSNSFDSNSKIGYFYLDENNDFSLQNISIPKLIDHNIECIYHDVNNIIWFGGFDGIVRYKERQSLVKTENSPALIKSIELVESDVLSFDKSIVENDDVLVFNFSNNSLRINYTALFYSSHNDVEYQTILEGFSNVWTSWSEESFKDFTNLSSGQYTFKVRAKDKYGTISNEAIIHFTIKPPIYYTWWAIVLYIAILISLFWLIIKLNEIRHATEKNKLELLVAERTNELVRQKEQTEKLVRKLLPMKTAQEIQETGKAKSRRYDLVTVLFADIQGFTKIAEDTNPEELVKYLDRLFTSFDKIIGKYNIEKIKTIGDAYMCAGGMPDKDRTNPVEVVLAALEMLDKLNELNKETNYDFKMRVGIHTGYVVAGVVGSHKLEYDIWGDTVNVANRMESHGVVGKVNISETTYTYVKEFFDCEQRDKTQVKYKGDLVMYLVKKIKQNLSEFSSGIKPNKDFNTKLQIIRINDLEEHMFEKLDKGLPKNLYYHNLKHTMNVYYKVEMIGREEKVSEEELLLLKTAAIFHDAGFMVSYDNNEVIGAKMAEDTLPLFKYTKEQIAIVKSLILATMMPPKPKNHLEMIICDADLDYLGRPDFTPVSQNLFRELFERGKINTIEQWNRMQYRFIQKHKYFTATARRLRDTGKEMTLRDLKKKI